MIYGYCRISTPKQSIERQVRNILKDYPDAHIIKEVYTGTKNSGRKEFENLMRIIARGDLIVFDSVSRMSRNAEEGFQDYQRLFGAGIELVFLKEPSINTDTYKEAMSHQVPMTGGDVDLILDGVNKFLLRLAEIQIRIAFEQSEKEVNDLHKRTSEGLVTAKLHGKRVGTPKGATFTTRKSVAAKKKMLEVCKDFGGTLSDKDAMKLIGIANNTFYKYKRELRQSSLPSGAQARSIHASWTHA